MPYLLALQCDNADCPEMRIGDCAICPDHELPEDEQRTLEHDARLDGWLINQGGAWCSRECREMCAAPCCRETEPAHR